MSRPRKAAASRMSHRITFLLTKAEYDKLEAKASPLGLSPSQLARKLAFSQASKLVINT